MLLWIKWGQTLHWFIVWLFSNKCFKNCYRLFPLFMLAFVVLFLFFFVLANNKTVRLLRKFRRSWLLRQRDAASRSRRMRYCLVSTPPQPVGKGCSAIEEGLFRIHGFIAGLLSVQQNSPRWASCPPSIVLHEPLSCCDRLWKGWSLERW